MFRQRLADDHELVTQAMRELVDAPSELTALPDPSFIWWKAQLLRRREAEREAITPLEIGEQMHIGAAVLGAIALAVGAWDQLPSLAIAFGAIVILSAVALVALEARRER
jgi:hypothetical protein